MALTFGSLFAGIGGFDLGLESSGMSCVWQVEKDEQCRKALAARFPGASRFEDVRNVGANELVRPDLICGGFPCQDLSVAGKRAGLAGKRSGLFYEFMRIVEELAPSWVLIENVGGLLSSNGGRDMGAILGTLGQLGYGTAYRVLDAQWFGVPQRRRRVFIVGCFGDWRRAAEVLFESESLPWNPPPRRETGTRVAASLTRGSASGSGVNEPGRRREDDVNIVVGHETGQGWWKQDDVAGTLRAEGENRPSRPSHNIAKSEEVTGRGTPPVPVAFQCHGTNVGPMGTLRAGNGNETGGVPFLAYGFHSKASASQSLNPSEVSPPLDRSKEASAFIGGVGVRRLTPLECVRLMGFPDDWLDGLGLSDSAKYRMLGNSIVVPVAKWIAERIVAAAD